MRRTEARDIVIPSRSAIRHKRSGFRSNASMVIRESLHRGGHGEHELLLETGVQRRKLLENGTEERNRVAKVLEDANVKIGNVLADVFGMSGQAMRQIELACTVPGIARDAAASILAEIGIDMSDRGPFATCHHLASWAGVCPGNNSSGGKRKSGNIRKGNRWLKATLSQTAWAGAAKKNSTFQFRYQRLKTRRGGKRAAIAVAHAQIIALYWVLRNGVPYQQQIRELQQQQ
jgi:transposase